MSVLKEVTVSGAVGKQVFNDAAHAIALSGVIQAVVLKSVIVNAVSASVITIRDGGPSGDTVMSVSVPAGTSPDYLVDHVRFDKGMHVKVIGTNSKCYLVIE